MHIHAGWARGIGCSLQYVGLLAGAAHHAEVYQGDTYYGST